MRTKQLHLITTFVLTLASFNLLSQTSTSPTQNVCVGTTEPYLLNPANSTSIYQWSLTGGGVITSGQGTSNISIDWGMVAGGPYILTVIETDINGCVGLPKTVDITINIVDDASFVLTDYCEGSSNAASGIVTPGGTFSFNPMPTGNETINSSTGEIVGGLAGNSYTVEYTTLGACSASQIESVLIFTIPNTGPIYHN